MEQVNDAFIAQTSRQFDEGFKRILHAIGQLDDNSIWQRPLSHSNSIGIILQHLIGNLNQWVCDAIGKITYHRDRPQEFKENQMHPKDMMVNEFTELHHRIQHILQNLDPSILLSNRRIQGLDETVLSALYKAATHLELHAGQIVYIAKYFLDEKYEVFWKPLNKERGKE